MAKVLNKAREPAELSRLGWALAFERKADELRPDMGRKNLETVIATLWPKLGREEPELLTAVSGLVDGVSIPFTPKVSD